MKIGCLTGGGDAVGLNAAIAGLVRGLLAPSDQTNMEVIGILGGWQGLSLATPEFIKLELKSVKGINFSGGTILHTSRENPLGSEEKMKHVIQNIRQLGLDGFVAIGGDDTLSIANDLSKRGEKVIGVPKTMDLDLSGTQYSVGFWSYVESVAKILFWFIANCKSNRRIGVCEVFGRHSGFTAATIGLAIDADYIIVPEQELSLEKLAQAMRACYADNHYGLVVVSEGVKLDTGSKAEIDPHDNELLFQKKIGEFIAKTIGRATGINTRPFQASHPFTCDPYAYDSAIGYLFGVKAASMVLNGEWGKMAALAGGDAISGQIVSLPLSNIKPRRLMDPSSSLYDLVARRNARLI